MNTNTGLTFAALMLEWNDISKRLRNPFLAEQLIDALLAHNEKVGNALALVKEDMETIDRMPFQSIGEVAEFAGESLSKHAEFMNEAAE